MQRQQNGVAGFLGKKCPGDWVKSHKELNRVGCVNGSNYCTSEGERGGKDGEIFISNISKESQRTWCIPLAINRV